MSKVVTVFGATGFVGSSVARTLLAAGWHVRAVTRDPNSHKAAALKKEGVQLVYIDPTDQHSISDALRGAQACFVQTHTDYSDPNSQKAEVTYGKAIADACRLADVGHVVYSTQLSVVKVIGINARHMDAKAEVELYMRDLDLPLTCLIVPFYYEHLLVPPCKPKLKDGCYEIGIPMGYTPLHMICTEDVGPIVDRILSNSRAYVHKTLSICGDKLTIGEIATTFTNALRPYIFRDKQVTSQQFRDQGLPLSNDMANMFEFFCRVDQRASVDTTRKLHPTTQTLDQWLRTNRDIALEAIVN
ncbi:hypothetical protein LSH36_1201g00060 [Paralvinella palmiformis]|uniref:NmrA-like family domain-containing protein 1 n=1 Tax=Paralvinella palmiformis TaxID=53620 RepID=A0AAD9IV61_9ANNE|nr:hypothetical protein LSH36_1201g00060 [Paralvinella palmiformis]